MPAIDASKARQLSLIARLGLAIPATRAVHRAADLAAAVADGTVPDSIGRVLLVQE